MYEMSMSRRKNQPLRVVDFSTCHQPVRSRGVRNLQLGKLCFCADFVQVQGYFRFGAPGPLGVTGGVYLNVLDVNIDIIVGTKGVTYTH